MIKPKLQNEALIADIQAFTSEIGFKVWWLGQSGFLLKWHGKHLLFDPYLSDSLTKKYAETDKPHTRMSELVISPEKLDFIDIVTSSHNHTDHLDAETLRPIFERNPNVKFIIPKANLDFVCERTSPLSEASHRPEGGTIIGLKNLQVFDYQGFTIKTVPAAHNEIETDEAGNWKYIGYVVSFGNYKIYHSGDTLWYNGMVEILKPFNFDVAFLPINGNKPERKVAGNLNAEEAARLGKEIGVKLVIPHHYHLFEFNTEEPSNFIIEAEKYGTPYKVLELGEGIFVS
jgi:L-ascorbate metabolism protein UlaG (beta-lactamase superfamily)